MIAVDISTMGGWGWISWILVSKLIAALASRECTAPMVACAVTCGLLRLRCEEGQSFGVLCLLLSHRHST